MRSLQDWRPPADRVRLRTIDAHTGGEPFRVVVDGYPDLPGETILERRRYAREHFDHLRTALMWEPRGHADMYGCIVTPPVSEGADFGVLFTHNEGYSSMCGHGIIAMATVAVETGMVAASPPETELGIDTPAGLVRAFARIDDGRVVGVRFHNVPSFVAALDEEIEVPGLGRVRYDLAYGGAFYAFVRADRVGLRCEPGYFRQLIDRGISIKRAIAAERESEHPFEEDLSFLYGVVFVEPSEADGVETELWQAFRGRLEVTRSHALIIEGNPPGVSKGDALRRLAAHLHIPQAEVMAIGDQDNDASMIAWAGVGVAMDNGSPAVKAVADWIAPPLAEDGAAVAIERFIPSA